ncbi:O-antigen polysaccharide polymerase Wzy [Blautia massiliensis (ex Liu et al. 2021)]|uniref:O-antigen polysaccharide polymerase Wzy n=1 Tax=Blautia massiliensis (ex Liu et al. 2021) TaxID=3062492 RepID=UPI003F8A6BC6
MYVNKKNVQRAIMLLFILFVDFILLILNCYKQLEQVLVFTGGFAIGTLVLTEILLYKTTNRINFFLLFIGVGFAFEFGQSMSVFLGGYNSMNSIWFLNINSGHFNGNEIWKAFFFMHMLMMSFAVSYIIFYKENTQISKEKNVAIIPQKRFKRECQIGYFLLSISIIPTFYMLKKDIMTIQVYGYDVTLQAVNGGIEKIYTLLSEFFPIAIVWLLIYEKRKRGRSLVLVLTVVYILLQLAGGSRIQVFRFVIILFLMYSLYYKKINKRNMILFLLAGLIGIFVLSLISSIRTMIYVSSNLSELIQKAALDLWENNFIVETLRELGNTQIINTLVYKECPKVIDYAYGTSYLKMFFSVVPNLWGGVHPSSIDVDSVFSPLYSKTTGLGSSFVAEAYWNFGFLSIIFCFLLGKIFTHIDIGLNEVCRLDAKDNKIKAYIYFYLCFLLIFWVRSSCNGFGRSVLFAAVPIIMNKITIK